MNFTFHNIRIKSQLSVCNRGTQFCVTAGSTLIYISANEGVMPMVVDLARVQTGSIETVAVENLPNSGLNNRNFVVDSNFVVDLCLLKIYNTSQSR